jgi:hypothetical protein
MKTTSSDKDLATFYSNLKKKLHATRNYCQKIESKGAVEKTTYEVQMRGQTRAQYTVSSSSRGGTAWKENRWTPTMTRNSKRIPPRSFIRWAPTMTRNRWAPTMTRNSKRIPPRSFEIQRGFPREVSRGFPREVSRMPPRSFPPLHTAVRTLHHHPGRHQFYHLWWHHCKLLAGH